MRHFSNLIVAAVLTTSLWACGGSGTSPGNGQDSTAAFTPAKPAGSVQVSFVHDSDPPQVKIHFALGEKTIDKSFELPLAEDMDAEDLYRTVWDKPNSCYIGVLKNNRGTRYYHASEGDDGALKIFQVGTPPAAVWHYAEGELGLGKATNKSKLTDHYKKNVTSGKIIADFIVRLEPASSKDSVQLYTEFGGVHETKTLAVPGGYVPKIQPTEEPDHCVFGLQRDDGFDPVLDIKVDGGKLAIKELGKSITN
ncbi:MAG TPA: hypothetical protein VFS25_19500 [Chitinophaga sp.]|uniref:hypothetical protein n=1 Tax=Chitinophaga sp. TaxID=1869181 RepID=UPI002DB6B8D6|nr:hypothetical protein [Chitinophaga sp.]HEU4555046.1 hypothetical protein [Chitinophaga sp.]